MTIVFYNAGAWGHQRLAEERKEGYEEGHFQGYSEGAAAQLAKDEVIISEQAERIRQLEAALKGIPSSR